MHKSYAGLCAAPQRLHAGRLYITRVTIVISDGKVCPQVLIVCGGSSAKHQHRVANLNVNVGGFLDSRNAGEPEELCLGGPHSRPKVKEQEEGGGGRKGRGGRGKEEGRRGEGRKEGGGGRRKERRRRKERKEKGEGTSMHYSTDILCSRYCRAPLIS